MFADHMLAQGERYQALGAATVGQERVDVSLPLFATAEIILRYVVTVLVMFYTREGRGLLGILQPAWRRCTLFFMLVMRKNTRDLDEPQRRGR